PGKKSILRCVSCCNCIVGRTNVAGCAHRNAVRHHEVDKLCHSGFFGSWSVIFGNDHLGEVFYHPVVRRREEQGFVRAHTGWGRRLGMILRAGKGPSAEAGKRARHRSDSNVAENFPALYPLPAHVPPQFMKPLSDSGYIGCVFSTGLNTVSSTKNWTALLRLAGRESIDGSCQPC